MEEHSNCQESVCSNCNIRICIMHAPYMYKIEEIRLGNITDMFYLCCGMCLVSKVLEDVHIHESRHSTIDPSWLPVIKQLRNSIQIVIEEIIKERNDIH